MSGGATGGHLYPAIAIIDRLRSLSAVDRVGYVGTGRSIEARVLRRVPGIEQFSIRCRGFERGRYTTYPGTIGWLLVGLLQSLIIILRFRPGLILGIGSYAEFPILFWGILFRIPTAIHEQNVLPGLTNRLLAPWVNRIFLSYEASLTYLSRRARQRSVITGNPVRKEILDDEAAPPLGGMGLDPRKRTVLAFGGSRGADVLNDAILRSRHKFDQMGDLQILLVVGENGNVEKIRKSLQKESIESIIVQKYIHKIGEALAAANLAVCRAGATTLAELSVRGIPSILIPWPEAAENHQEANARFFEKEGASCLVEEVMLAQIDLAELVAELIRDGERLERMRRHSRALGKSHRDALTRIIQHIEELTNEQ